MGEDRRVKVKAYDQLRRGKSKDIIPLKGGQDDVVSVTQSMCRYLNLTAGYMPTGISYKVPKDKVKYQDTWIDVIYGLIGDTLLNTKTADNPQENGIVWRTFTEKSGWITSGPSAPFGTW